MDLERSKEKNADYLAARGHEYRYDDISHWLQCTATNRAVLGCQLFLVYYRKVFLLGVKHGFTSGTAREVATSLLAYNCVATPKQVGAIWAGLSSAAGRDLLKKMWVMDGEILRLRSFIFASELTTEAIETLAHKHPLYMWLCVYLGYREPDERIESNDAQVAGARQDAADLLAILQYRLKSKQAC